jgi:hypothetical protein
MFTPKFLDRLEPFGDRPRHPVAPRFMRLIEPPLGHHALDRRHVTSLLIADNPAA